MAPAVWPVVERLLAWSLPARDVAPVLGDLIEDYARHAATGGRLRAELWLVGECLSLVSSYRAARRRLRSPRRPPMDMLRSDVVHAWRAVRARPAATIATAAVLALGIGLVSAMFALADPYLLRPLPFGRPAELHSLDLRTMQQSLVPTLADLEARRDLFTGVLAQETAVPVAVTIDGRELTLRLAAVSRGYFAVLGIPMVMPADWRPVPGSAETPVILTAAASARVFGRTEAAARVLRQVDEGGGFRVTGTLTARFVDPFARPGVAIDGFIPLADGPLQTIRLTGGGYSSTGPWVLARLRPGTRPADVESALSTVSAEGVMTPRAGRVASVEPIVTRLTARVRPLALGALAAGALILMVCAANVANLLLARGATRTREFASREALGASRGAIARLVLVELGLVTALGVAAGLLLARAALVAVTLVIPDEYTMLGTPVVTPRVVALAAACGLLVMLAGMIPGWAAWRVTPLALVNRLVAGETRRVRALRFTMIVAQTAVAVTLLVGGVLLGRSYARLVTQDPGYDAGTFAVTAVYADRAQVAAEMEAAVARIERLPGVGRAGASPGPLVDGLRSGGVGGMTIGGRRVPGLPRAATIGFFDAAGSRLVAGRLWTRADGGRTAIVTESFAAVCCDGRSPVGQPLVSGDRTLEVVGVVKDLFTTALDEPPGPAVFVPVDARGAASAGGWVNYVVRAELAGEELTRAVERELRAGQTGVTIRGSASMRQRLMESVNDRSFATLIVVFFGIAAIGVSAAGIVGAVGFVVARRTREIAIRLAIGASAGTVRRLVAREAGVAAAIGAAAGLTAARWAWATAGSLLYGIEPTDTLSFVLAASATVAVVVVAAWIPARRASRLSPNIALRAE